MNTVEPTSICLINPPLVFRVGLSADNFFCFPGEGTDSYTNQMEKTKTLSYCYRYVSIENSNTFDCEQIFSSQFGIWFSPRASVSN